MIDAMANLKYAILDEMRHKQADLNPQLPISFDPLYYATSDVVEQGQAIVVKRRVDHLRLENPGYVIIHPDDLWRWRARFDMVHIRDRSIIELDTVRLSEKSVVK